VGVKLKAPVRRVNSCLNKISGEKFGTGKGQRSLAGSVKARVGMGPHAETPPPPVLSPEVTATQALELLASVSAGTHVSDTEFVAEPVSAPQP